jgi:transcriptional regulator with XRE-family HTH domain
VAGSAYARRFGQTVRHLREARNMSQEQLADASRLHSTHISLIETGRRSVRLETIMRLARALGIQPGQLLPPLREPGAK